MATIIVPFVHGKLHDDTRKAIQGSGCYHRFVDLDPNDEGAYGRLIRKLWLSQTTIIICEHDVVPTLQQIREIQSCNHDWCNYDYDDGLYPSGPSFGFARFSGRLMAQHPEAAEVALIIGKRRDTEAEWWRVDSLMARDLFIRGAAWTLHDTLVHHLHQGGPSDPR